MLHIHQSNHCESLTAALLRQLAAGERDPFSADTIIVPSAALRRWLSLAIAEREGICTQVHFDFLAQWLWRQIARLVPGVAERSPFAPSSLAWRIWAAFDDAGFVAAHARLAGYLAKADAVMRYELAQRVATLFDRYLTYRSDWLQAWADGRSVLPASSHGAVDESWQAALWRRLIADLGVQQAHPADGFIAALRHGGTALAQQAGLPRCVHVFALPAMPPLHFKLLRAMARCIDLHLYALNPCSEFWFDVVGPRRLARLAARGEAAGHEVGNRLLAGWARQTQAWMEALHEDAGSGSDEELFTAPTGDSLLARVQTRILELQDIEPAALPLAPNDDSIVVHRCHSAMRELEALQDHLLGLFAADATLQPSDIAVLLPDLDSAAPLIDALFGTAPPDRFIRYTISGARELGAAPTRALLAVLALLGSRFAASEVFTLLQQAIVARRFGLDDAALSQVHAWIIASGMRWALDGEHRAGFDVPADARHTLDEGMSRLFLGYALPQQVDEPLAGLLPAGAASGSEAIALGAFWRFVQRLAELQQRVRLPLSASAWADCLHQLLRDFVQPVGDEADQLSELRRQLGSFAESLPQRPLPLAVLRLALTEHLQAAARGAVAAGGVSFAPIAGLRGLPFEVVCVLGLNDGSWPQTQQPDEFDLLALAPRRGDRQRRDEERNVLFDLLLGARRSLYLSHVGRSVRDNSELPPSVLVSELLDMLVPAIADDAGDAQALQRARQRLVVDHPLQAFSPEAFRADGDPRLSSFNRELAEALDSAQRAASMEPLSADGPPADTPFFGAALASPGAEWRNPSLAQLIEFFRNPCRYLLRRRLGIDLLRDEDELLDDEPFLADWQSRQALAARLLPRLLATPTPDNSSLRALAHAGAELPGGALGEALLEPELTALRVFADRVREATAEPCLSGHAVELAFDIDAETWTLHAAMADLRAGGLRRWRYGALAAGDRIEAWLSHLVLCASGHADVAPSTWWLASDDVLRLKPVAEPYAALHELVRLYREGLSAPLHFFPKAAWAFVEAEGDRRAAEQVWQADDHQPFAESAGAYYQLALRGIDAPLDARFIELAATVFVPLRDHIDNSAGAA